MSKIYLCVSFQCVSIHPVLLCCCSVAKSCLTLCNHMDCSTPGFPVLHYLPEFAQTHIHWIDDAIQPSHPPSPPSPVLNLSQHQGVFQWVGSSHQVAKSLELHFSPCNEYSGLFHLGLIGLIFLLPKEFSGVFSDTIVQKYQFLHTQTSLWSSSHISLHDYSKNHSFDCMDLYQQSDVSAF